MRRPIFAVAQLHCLKQNIETLSAIQEKSGYLPRQRGNARFVGNPYLTGLWKGCPSCIPNLRCAKTSEVQFDFVPQKSGHEGAVSNAVTTA